MTPLSYQWEIKRGVMGWNSAFEPGELAKTISGVDTKDLTLDGLVVNEADQLSTSYSVRCVVQHNETFFTSSRGFDVNVHRTSFVSIMRQFLILQSVLCFYEHDPFTCQKTQQNRIGWIFYPGNSKWFAAMFVEIGRNPRGLKAFFGLRVILLVFRCSGVKINPFDSRKARASGIDNNAGQGHLRRRKRLYRPVQSRLHCRRSPCSLGEGKKSGNTITIIS